MPRVKTKGRSKRTLLKIRDLNEYLREKGPKRLPFTENAIDIAVYFRPDHIVSAIKRRILKATYVVGNIAWLSNKELLDALRTRKGVSIIIQHDKALLRKHRPDYLALPPMDNQAVAVRTIRSNSRALAHHKMAVFLDSDRRVMGCLTGSFNWTQQSSHNLEHICCFDDAASLGNRFLQEHLDTRKISKPIRRIRKS